MLVDFFKKSASYYHMEQFSSWLKSEGFDFVTEPQPQAETNPYVGKGGLSDNSNLPMGMRQPAITSAFNTYSNPKSRRRDQRVKKLP